MAYAEIAVDAPVKDGRTFTYTIPPHLTMQPGQMVQAPFGPRMADGIVIQISATTQIDPVRPIEACDPLGPVVMPLHLELARWISDYYKAPLYASIALMLPPGFRNRTDSYLTRPSDEALASLEVTLGKQLLDQFRGHKQRTREASVRQALGRRGQADLDSLLRRGLMARTWTWRTPRVVPLGKDPGTGHMKPADLPLTPTHYQEQALKQIHSALDAHQYQSFLIHGITGSGKTEVYLQALSRCLRQGRKGIILVPEISLTPQMVERFQARFPGRVAVLHSRLSLVERRRMWWGVFRGSFDVVIGSRSALFAPVHPLGLIVIDEEHEWTYKQQDAEPRYHARAVAMHLALSTGATVVLGSATPDVVTYHRAVTGQSLGLITLPYRLGDQDRTEKDDTTVSPYSKTEFMRRQPSEYKPIQQPLAQVEIVDMRRELREGNRSIFSRSLQESLKETASKGNQVILFINRRGAAGVVQCRDCGHVMRCRSCDTPFTYHVNPEQLLCHQCNRRVNLVHQCPNCRSQRIRFLGLGTQRVVNELEVLLPHVSTLRWDRDVATTNQPHEEVVERFARGEAQVLVGTQMVAKGLHIPAVTLVGAVLADIGLHLPDFRAGERVFQLLCQVAGRAGRGIERGSAVIQTYQPDHYALDLAARQDYPAFYCQELAFRQTQRLPPYSRLLRLLITHTNAGRCQRDAEHLGRVLRHQGRAWDIAGVDVIGPAPSYPTRVRGRYRWHILLRGGDPRLLLDKVDIPNGWLVDVDPVSVL